MNASPDPLDAAKMLPIELEMEKRKRKEPSKYDEQKRWEVMMQEAKRREAKVKEQAQSIEGLKKELKRMNEYEARVDYAISTNEWELA